MNRSRILRAALLAALAAVPLAAAAAWTFVGADDRIASFVDLASPRPADGGTSVTLLLNYLQPTTPDSGVMTTVVDCAGQRKRDVAFTRYEAPMAQGAAHGFTVPATWDPVHPDTLLATLANVACGRVPLMSAPTRKWTPVPGAPEGMLSYDAARLVRRNAHVSVRWMLPQGAWIPIAASPVDAQARSGVYEVDLDCATRVTSLTALQLFGDAGGGGALLRLYAPDGGKGPRGPLPGVEPVAGLFDAFCTPARR